MKWIILALFVFLSGCATCTVQKYSEDIYSPKDENAEIDVYDHFWQKPKWHYTSIAELRTQGNSDKDYQEINVKARQLGADGVIIASSRPDTGISAIAIKYLDRVQVK